MTAGRFVLSHGSVKTVWFATWIVATTVPLCILTTCYNLPLPDSLRQSAAFGAVKNTSTATQHWRTIHFLAEGCPCSRTVGNYLRNRGPIAGVDESVVIGDVSNIATTGSLGRTMRSAGFKVKPVSDEPLISGLQISGAPWFIVVDPRGRVAYSGGYAPQRPATGVELLDIFILDQVRQGTNVLPYPAYGCATNQKLQRLLDPIGIKY